MKGKSNMLYLHGFANTFFEGSKKVKAFSKYYNVIPYSYDSSRKHDDILNDMSKFVKENNIKIVSGVSLGGFFAMELSEKHNLYSVTLNPSNNPQKSLKRFLGEVHSFKANKYFNFTKEILNSYPTKLPNGFGLVMLKENDKIISSEETKKMLPKSYKSITVPGDDHGFKDIENYADLIRREHILHNKEQTKIKFFEEKKIKGDKECEKLSTYTDFHHRLMLPVGR